MEVNAALPLFCRKVTMDLFLCPFLGTYLTAGYRKLGIQQKQIKNANTPPQIFAKMQTMQASFCFLTFIRKSHFEYLMVLQTSAWSYARLMQFTYPLKNVS